MPKKIDPKQKEVQLKYAKTSAINKLAKFGMLTAMLEMKINNAKTKKALLKIMPSNDEIKKFRKIQRFKKVSGGSIKHISTTVSLRTISTPIGGQAKK